MEDSTMYKITAVRSDLKTGKPKSLDSKSKLIGKVFISHASPDKPFVRRLSRAIERNGFSVWLDERELLSGDPLAAKISEAIQASRAIIVVVSSASLKSKWLSFELNQATEKMIQGGCRIIPVIKEKVVLPPEVAGLLYADFSTSFKLGLQAVVTALQHDAERAAQSSSFWQRTELLLDEVFDGKGSASLVGDFKSIDYSLLWANSDQGEVSCAYDIVSGYSNPTKALTSSWLYEYLEEISRYDESLFLVVSERPIEFEMESVLGKDERVGYLCLETPGRQAYSVFVSLFDVKDENESLRLVTQGKNLIIELGIASLKDQDFA